MCINNCKFENYPLHAEFSLYVLTLNEESLLIMVVCLIWRWYHAIYRIPYGKKCRMSVKMKKDGIRNDFIFW